MDVKSLLVSFFLEAKNKLAEINNADYRGKAGL
jgi:hypothetical protein